MVAIKGENIIKHIERGEMGPVPDTNLLCETYIHGTVAEMKSKAYKMVNIQCIDFDYFNSKILRKLTLSGLRRTICSTWESCVP